MLLFSHARCTFRLTFAIDFDPHAVAKGPSRLRQLESMTLHRTCTNSLAHGLGAFLWTGCFSLLVGAAKTSWLNVVEVLEKPRPEHVVESVKKPNAGNTKMCIKNSIVSCLRSVSDPKRKGGAKLEARNMAEVTRANKVASQAAKS